MGFVEVRSDSTRMEIRIPRSALGWVRAKPDTCLCEMATRHSGARRRTTGIIELSPSEALEMKKLTVNKTRLVELNRGQEATNILSAIWSFCVCNTLSEASAGNKTVCLPTQALTTCVTSHP